MSPFSRPKITGGGGGNVSPPRDLPFSTRLYSLPFMNMFPAETAAHVNVSAHDGRRMSVAGLRHIRYPATAPRSNYLHTHGWIRIRFIVGNLFKPNVFFGFF